MKTEFSVRSAAVTLVTAARASLVATATLASAAIMLTAAFLMATPPAFAAPGDLVGTLTFSQNCSSGIGTGITFDGTNLWVTCYASGANPDLLRIDPATGAVTYSTNVAGGLGSIAYDAGRNVIWAAAGGGGFSDQVVKIPLTATTPRTVTGPYIPAIMVPPSGLVDGLAYDGLANTIYWSPDVSTTVFKYDATSGASLGSFPWTGSGCYNSGLAIGGQLLFQGSDGCSHVWVVNKTTLAPAFDFSTVVPGDPNFRDEGLTCDTKTFSALGKQVMWSKEAYSPNRAAAYEIPVNTCGIGGGPVGTCTSGDAVIVNKKFPILGTMTYDISSPAKILSSIKLAASTNIGSFTLPTIAVGGHSATGGVFVKANPAKSATFELQATFVSPDFACNIDPIITTLRINTGHSAVQSFHLIPKAEHFIDIENGNPGLNWVGIRVNGRPFAMRALQSSPWASGTIRIDASAAMTLENNTLTFIGKGETGSFANINVSDSAPVSASRAPAAALSQNKRATSAQATGIWGHLMDER